MKDNEKQDYTQVQARLLTKHLIESENRKKEKQIEEMAKLIKDYCIIDASYGGKPYANDYENLARILLEHYQLKLPEDSVVLSREEYHCLKSIEKNYDPFWFCSFGGCEGVCKECKDTCEMSIFVKERKETAEKFYNKINENIAVFKLDITDENYISGYAMAIADICEKIDEIAKQCGVEIKE